MFLLYILFLFLLIVKSKEVGWKVKQIILYYVKKI
jgi:hypothetical protein